MQVERLTPGPMIVRFLTALLLVYATFNPEGISFFHWTVVPIMRGEGIGSVGSLKVVAGILLLIGWLVFFRAARRSLGILGAGLLLGGAIIWLLVGGHVVSPRSARAVAHIALVIGSLLLAICPFFFPPRRRVTGPLNADQAG
jgi:Family of unknown function (DUF6524)